jgi:hypothetical protein
MASLSLLSPARPEAPPRTAEAGSPLTAAGSPSADLDAVPLLTEFDVFSSDGSVRVTTVFGSTGAAAASSVASFDMSSPLRMNMDRVSGGARAGAARRGTAGAQHAGLFERVCWAGAGLGQRRDRITSRVPPSSTRGTRSLRRRAAALSMSCSPPRCAPAAAAAARGEALRFRVCLTSWPRPTRVSAPADHAGGAGPPPRLAWPGAAILRRRRRRGGRRAAGCAAAAAAAAAAARAQPKRRVLPAAVAAMRGGAHARASATVPRQQM